MEGRLGKTTRHPVMKLLVDFNNLGYENKDQWVDITDDILDISGSKEKSGRQLGSVTSDIATFTADNTDKKFSNDNPNSPFKGKIKSNLKYRLLTGFQGETLIPYASGYIEAFTPSWLDKKIQIKTTDYFKLFKGEEVPEESFQDISFEALVNILCDHVGLPNFIVRHIPKTEFYFNYFKFEEENCFEALKALMELSVGEAYFEQEQFFVKTKLALDYQLDTTIDHNITVDDLFDFEENVDGQAIINSLSLSSQYKSIAPLQVVFATPENMVRVENEQIIYESGNSIYVDPKNLPILNDDNNPMTLKNLTQGRTIYILGHNPMTGKIDIHPDSLAYLAPNDILTISYSYQQLALLAGQSRKYVFALNEQVDSLNKLDIAVWDEEGNVKRKYSETPDTLYTVSKQSMTFDTKSNTVTLVLKNNYASPITISTLQLRGYPIKVISPIEVFVKDLPSIEEFGKKEISFQNNYINNIKLAEKIGQYIVDNNKGNRKRINIDIAGYPEFTLDDISKVTEASSGTSHKFTNERIDYSFNPDSGWNVKAALLELDSEPWVYESFKGESWERTNPGKPDDDFLKDISANLVKNGGAELYTGFSDFEDIGAIEKKHIVPDYWRFVRSSGNATSRIRDGGNLVLHGLHSFEITTSNSGAGHFEQIIPMIIPSSTYILSLVVALTSSSGKASVLQYADDVLVQTDSIDITSDGTVELMISSLATTNSAIIKIEKLAGTEGSESVVFDKVKFENAKDKTPYIETEETSAVQVGQRYANSLLIGNNYGIEVFDDLNNTRVRIGQYQPNKYGIQVFGGAIEIIGGLPEDQLDPEMAKKWNDASSWIDDYANDAILTPVEKREVALEWARIENEYNALIAQSNEFWPSQEAQQERDTLTILFNGLNTYLNITPDEPNGLSILDPLNMINQSEISRNEYNTKFTDLYAAMSGLRSKVIEESKRIADNTQDNLDELGTKLPYKIEFDTPDGLIFMNGQGTKTINAIVYRGTDNITDGLAPEKFIWKRRTTDEIADAEWNSAMYGVGKSVVITADEFKKLLVLKCEITD